MSFLEILKVEVRRNLTELIILLQQFVDLCFVSMLVNFVSRVEFLDVVDQTQQTVYLLLVLELCLLVAAQMHCVVHHHVFNYTILCYCLISKSGKEFERLRKILGKCDKFRNKWTRQSSNYHDGQSSLTPLPANGPASLLLPLGSATSLP